MKSILFHCILIAYLFASLGFWLFFGLRQRWVFQLASCFTGLGVVLQTATFIYHVYSQPWQFRGDSYASMGLLSWAIGGIYFLAWRRFRIEALGAFVIPLAFLAAAYSGVPVAAAADLPPAFQQLWLGIHIFLAVLGYAALALTFGAGVMYLMQAQQLKSRQPGNLFHRLPSLSLLDELNGQALLLGFPLLTQGLITGSIWAKYVRGSYWQWSLTSLPLLLAWTMYAVLLSGRYTLGWQGQRAAVAAVVGFLIVLASYFVHML